MKIVVIHGQNHKGSTYHITKLFLDRLSEKSEEILEFQTNSLKPCTGCFTCIVKDEKCCPHGNVMQPIMEAIERADIVIAESPNYCMGMTGQLKMLFDHMGYRWMSHRPHPAMRSKIGIAISTTAGMGARKVTKSIKQQMFWWGIPKIYRIAESVGAMSWDDVKPQKKEKISSKVNKATDHILKKLDKVQPGIVSRMLFRIMKMQQKGNNWNLVDKKHWEDNGWI